MENYMTRSRVRLWCGIIVAAVMTVGCVNKDASKKPSAQGALADSARKVAAAHALIGPAAKAALDSGNALYRKKEYASALAYYRSASTLAPQHAAPLFGIYLVARATNNVAMADSALAGIRQRNPMAPLPHAPHASATQKAAANLPRKASAI
jgi:hypothetical protein